MLRCKIKRAEYNRKYYLANKDRIRAELLANPEKKKAREEKHKIYMENLKAQNPNWMRERAAEFLIRLKKEPDRYKKRLAANNKTSRRWRKNNPDKVRAYLQSPEMVLKNRARARIRNALKWGGVKLESTTKTLGCSIPQLKGHLESLFQPGMSWNNRGDWEIDHIRPCASFNLLDPEQYRCCFHFSNLQPLWRKENREKGAKWL